MRFLRIGLALAVVPMLFTPRAKVASAVTAVPFDELQFSEEKVSVDDDINVTRPYYRPAVGYYRPAVGYYRPAAGYYRPAAGYYRPAAGYYRPAVGYYRPYR